MTFQNFAPDDPFGTIAEHNRGRILPRLARDWFTENGVAPVSLVKTWAGYFDMVFHDDVVFLDGGAFEFGRHRGGKSNSALTFLCWSDDGVAVDICAWQATTGRMALWLNQACMLGEDNLTAPRPAGALAVHQTPLDWFKANRAGVVIVDGKRAAAKLRGAGPLVAADIEHGKQLKKLLTVPPPEILIPEVAA